MEPTVERSNVERPKSVAKAVQLLASAVAIGLLNAILTVVQRTSGIPMLVVLLIVIAFFGLLFFLVIKISAGRNWARLVWLVWVLLLIANISFSILAYPETVGKNVISIILSIITMILQLIGTALLFTKNSNVWFKTSK